MSHRHQPPVNITSARQARSADIHRRQVRYLLSMGIRTICFIMAVIASGWLRWGLVAAAVILPYVAVVIANASNTRTSEARLGVPPDSHHQLNGPTKEDDASE